MSRRQLGALVTDHAEKLRFLLTGVCNTALSIAMYNIMLSGAEVALGGRIRGLSAEYLYIVVFWVSWVLMVMVSTTTMKFFAFRSPGHLGSQILRAYVVYLPAQGLSTAVLWASVHLLGLSPRIGQLAAIVISTVFSYLGHKHFTFRGPVELDEALEPHDRQATAGRA